MKREKKRDVNAMSEENIARQHIVPHYIKWHLMIEVMENADVRVLTDGTRSAMEHVYNTEMTWFELVSCANDTLKRNKI